jgi:hypothetical protein
MTASRRFPQPVCYPWNLKAQIKTERRWGILILFILVRHTNKLNYKIIVNVIQFADIAFTCFGHLTIFRRHKIDDMFRNYYYKVHNKYVKVFV